MPTVKCQLCSEEGYRREDESDKSIIVILGLQYHCHWPGMEILRVSPA